MSRQKTSKGTPSVISSPELGDGLALFDFQDGPTTAPSGPDLALANLSARQAISKGLMTSGTFGRLGIGSSTSFALQQSLESKSRARLRSLGSTLYLLTWKARVTPSQRVICALRASERPTSGNDFGSWLTPTAQSPNSLRGKGQDPEKRKAQGHTVNLTDQVTLSAWPTPSTRDHKGGYEGGGGFATARYRRTRQPGRLSGRGGRRR